MKDNKIKKENYVQVGKFKLPKYKITYTDMPSEIKKMWNMYLDNIKLDLKPTYVLKEKDLNKAMKAMECWETQNHLIKCKKCRKQVLKEIKEKIEPRLYTLWADTNGSTKKLAKETLIILKEI